MLITYNTRISIVYVVITILFVVFLSRIRIKKKPLPVISKTSQIKKFNKITYYDQEIMARWRVGFGAGSPYVDDVELFCTKHNPPLRLMFNKCTDFNCKNSNYVFDTNIIENDLESRLRHQWDLINEN